MVQKKIANLKDFSTQTDLSIPIDCEVLVVEDQIPEPVKSSPAPNHEASLQKKKQYYQYPTHQQMLQLNLQ